jgi:hypothetical protein
MTLQAVRAWVLAFVNWYNHRHCHSGLRFATPAQRHQGEERHVLAQRRRVYAAAKDRHPQRWSGSIRNWTVVGPTTLNPEPEERNNQRAA